MKMQGVTTEGRRERALARFQEGKYEEAAREFRAELDEQENTENWNDWAAAETFCGRADAAISGFTRALQLDSGNTEARDNLLALLKQCVNQLEEAKGKMEEESALVARPGRGVPPVAHGETGAPEKKHEKRHGKRRRKAVSAKD